MKVALVYDRVNKWGGAERVLLTLHELFPDAPLYTSVYDAKKAPWAKVFPEVIPSFLQKIPFIRDKHEFLGTLTPLAFESLNLEDFDVVISVTSEAGKGVITKPSTLHICYCLTPTRYLWSGEGFYFKNPPSMLKSIPFFNFLSKSPVAHLKRWDVLAAQRPDVFIAISQEVKRRIKKYYQRDSSVIYPPVNTSFFNPKKGILPRKGDFFLVVSRLIPYKRVDLAIKAFNKLKKPLVVVGEGSEEGYLKKIAKKNVTFVGRLTDAKLASYYKRTLGVIFPQEEDFGLVAVEAISSGTPVIAFNKGGAKEIVTEGKTGVFFNSQTVESLTDAVVRFGLLGFNQKDLIKSASRFSKDKFKRKFLGIIKKGQSKNEF